MTRDPASRDLIACLALAAAAAAVSAPAPAQEPLGRFFFTPAQRASLDAARTQRARRVLVNEQIEQEAVAPAPQTITYGGLVRRSDGKTTIWINNQPVRDREPAGGGTIVNRVRPDGSVSLQVPQSGRRVTLKPGQSVELLSGSVKEGYSRRPETSSAEPKPATKPPPANAGTAKTVVQENAAWREREEREAQRLEDAIARALVETASARPLATPAPAAPAKP